MLRDQLIRSSSAGASLQDLAKSQGFRYRRKGMDLHFVTIGFANGQYVDVVADHEIWQGNGTVIEGCGKLQKRGGSYSIKCEKMWKTWL